MIETIQNMRNALHVLKVQTTDSRHGEYSIWSTIAELEEQLTALEIVLETETPLRNPRWAKVPDSTLDFLEHTLKNYNDPDNWETIVDTNYHGQTVEREGYWARTEWGREFADRALQFLEASRGRV